MGRGVDSKDLRKSCFEAVSQHPHSITSVRGGSDSERAQSSLAEKWERKKVIKGRREMEREEGTRRPFCEFWVVFVRLCWHRGAEERNDRSLSNAFNLLGLSCAA